MALLFAGSVAYQALVIVPEMNGAAARIQADRDEEAARLRMLNELRKAQVRNEADLVVRQEQNLRLVKEMSKTLVRGD